MNVRFSSMENKNNTWFSSISWFSSIQVFQAIFISSMHKSINFTQINQIQSKMPGIIFLLLHATRFY